MKEIIMKIVMNMSIGEKKDIFCNLLFTYLSEKKKGKFYIERITLDSYGFDSENPYGEFWKTICPQLKREGVLKFYSPVIMSLGERSIDSSDFLSKKNSGYYFEVNKEKLKTKTSGASKIVATPILGVYYNGQSGVGSIDNRRFKFKDDQPEYKIFLELYKNIGQKILRERVLYLMGFAESKDLFKEYDGNGKRLIAKGVTTYKINELVKKMRKRTGLNKNKLVNNNGNLTLIGKRLKSLPE